MKYLLMCAIASAGLFLNGCATAKTAGTPNSTPSTPPGPVTVSAAPHGVIGAGTKIAVRTSEAISTVQDAPGKTYSAETIGDIVDQGSNVLVPKGSRVQLVALASPGGTPAESALQLSVVSITVNGKSYQVNATAEGREASNATELADRPGAANTGGKQVRLATGSVLNFRIEQAIPLYGYAQ